MIIDKLKNSGLYEKNDSRLKDAFDFLRSLENKAFQEGRYTILDEEVYADLFSYDTMEPEKLKYEHHRRYADIHYVLKGEECICWAELEEHRPENYDEESDVGFLPNIRGTAIPLREGDIVVLYPEDVHKPKCILTESCHVEKVVVKVRLEASK